MWLIVIVVVMHWRGCPAACGTWVPQPGIKPASPALQGGFLTIGPAGRSPRAHLLSLPDFSTNCDSPSVRDYQLAVGRASWTNLFTLLWIQTTSKACQLHLSYTDCVFPSTLPTLPWLGLCRRLLTWVLLSLRTVPSNCLPHWGQLPGRCNWSLCWSPSKVWSSNGLLLTKGKITLFKPSQGLHFQHHP